jgi:hypothetical protein
MKKNFLLIWLSIVCNCVAIAQLDSIGFITFPTGSGNKFIVVLPKNITTAQKMSLDWAKRTAGVKVIGTLTRFGIERWEVPPLAVAAATITFELLAQSLKLTREQEPIFKKTPEVSGRTKGKPQTSEDTILYRAAKWTDDLFLQPCKNVGTTPISIGIIDGGIALNAQGVPSGDLTYFDAQGSRDFTGEITDNSMTINDLDSVHHGTHTYGVIEKAYQKWGMNPHSKITVLKAFTKNGEAELWHILQAINHAITLKLNIISGSFNYRDNNPRPNNIITTKLVLEHVMDRAKEYNLLFIASAGNDSINVDSVRGAFPATFLSENLLVVAASENAAAHQAKYTNYGPKSVDVAANGTFITRDGAENVEFIARGTSFAAPIVAATTAFLAAQAGVFQWERAKQLLINQLDKKSVNWIGKLEPNGGVLKPVCWNDAIWNTAASTSITHAGRAGETVDIIIVNMSGQVILSEKTVLNADAQWIWDWNSLNIANGIYIMRCQIGNGAVLTQKIVKMSY